MATHHAPAVSYPIGRSAALQRGLLALGLLSGLPCLYLLFEALALQQPAQAAIISIVICVALWCGVGLALWQFWRHQRSRTLRWDGADWWLSPLGQRGSFAEEICGRAHVRFDGQRWVLLSWTPSARSKPCWLWADAAIDPVRWHLLRCALYSKPPRPGDDARDQRLQRA